MKEPMETLKFTFSFISAFISTISTLWLIFVYPYSNVSLKSAWLGTAAGIISALILVLILACYVSGIWPRD
jgi:hypothetical protein